MNPVQKAILAFIFTLIVICVAGICCLVYDAVSSFIRSSSSNGSTPETLSSTRIFSFVLTTFLTKASRIR